MDIFDIADDIIDVAKKVLPLVVPGAAPAIAAAEAVIALGTKVKPALLEQDQAKLNVTLDELSARVLAHADQTTANLRR